MELQINTSMLNDYIKSIKEGAELVDSDMFNFISKNMAGRFLMRVIPRTPVESNESFWIKTIGGHFSPKMIRGGALRRGWTENKSVAEYLNTLPISHSGSVYQFTISNNVSYAPYVEYGHRQNIGQFVPYIGKTINGVRQGARLKKAAVKGQFMMTNTYNEIQNMLEGLGNKLIKDYLEKAFGI